ncbi:hypothetical protein [Geomicrobium sp. JCM 19038]|uniref:hypothetical protein n=1 Tax=Geomicrobium sp. JCM 19038 TaxID=1460635 RepID=UPI0005A63EC3|nr:hypothetical protein [Geomicrobium sp. JCM 19038]
METLINITNGLTAFALFAFVILVILMKKEGKDERAQYLGYKLFSFLFTFLMGGLALIIFITGWEPIDYILLRVCITTLMSLNIFIGLGYWIYISKKI